MKPATQIMVSIVAAVLAAVVVELVMERRRREASGTLPGPIVPGWERV